MDPFTMMALMGAGSSFINQNMNRMNSTPNNALANQPMINMAQYEPYMKAHMAAGFNTNSQLYQNASQVANARLNDSLASRGMINSSAGTQATMGLNTQLANSYIDNQMNRQNMALSGVGNFQNAAMGSNLALGQAQNGAGWNYYNAQMQQNQNNTGAFAGLMGGLSAAYGGQQQQDNFNKLLASAGKNYNNSWGGGGSDYGTTYNPGGGTGYLGVNTQY